MGIVCPDCGKELDRVEVEVSVSRRYVVSEANKTLTPDLDSDWENSDESYRCPECGTLNIDHLVQEYDRINDRIEINV